MVCRRCKKHFHLQMETGMETYMVTMSDRHGNDERVLVSAPSTDTEDDIRNYILRPETRGARGESVTLTDPYVIGIRKLRVKHPPVRTNFAEIRKVGV